MTATMSNSERIASLAGLTIKAATAYGRPDLVAVAERLLRESQAPSARVAVAGDFKRGKSSLVNALLDTDICVTDEVISSPLPTVFRGGGEQSIEVLRRSSEGEERRDSISGDAIDAVHFDPVDGVRVDVRIDRPLLGLGLEVVDCPAAAGDGHPGRVSTVATARQSDAVLLVTDASQPMTRFELELLEDVLAVCPATTVVMTRIDIAPEWRRLQQINRQALADRGLQVEVVSASSVLRNEALRLGDRSTNDESGFARLVEIIRTEIAAESDALMTRRAARVLGRIAFEILSDFERQLETLTSPAAAEEQLAEVTAARKRAEGLRLASARWQRMLVEGGQDIQAEVDQRLGVLGRSVLEEGTGLLDTLDPAKDWETFEPWLRQAMIDHIDGVFLYLDEEMASLVQQIGREVESAVESTAAIQYTTDRTGGLDDLEVAADFDGDKMAVFGGSLTALRGSYSGLLMFGMLGSLFGFALLNPVTVALGLTVGGKALWDERGRQVKTRRAKAVAGMKTFVDRSIADVRNELRVIIRARQREIRDQFLEHAETLVSAADAALIRTRSDAQATSTERARKKADVEAEVGRTKELASMIGTQLAVTGS